jgi:hypothetical protein
LGVRRRPGTESAVRFSRLASRGLLLAALS